MIQDYQDDERYRTALLQQLQNRARAQQMPLQRIYYRFLFERFWVRVQTALPQAVMKGGAALEFRLDQARMTKDLDLSVSGLSRAEVLSKLQTACFQDHQDRIQFSLAPDPQGGLLRNDVLQYEGWRLNATARVAGRVLGYPFGVDVALGEWNGGGDELTVQPLPVKMGFDELQLRVYPLERHLAEKLHAYTQPRTRPNSRVKDLPDMGLLIGIHQLTAGAVLGTLAQTYAQRGTHALPSELPTPSAEWTRPYQVMATANHLMWPTLEHLHDYVNRFFAPVLSRQLELQATWSPLTQSWA